MRRIAATIALLCSALVALAVPETVHASNTASEPEMIAHAIGTQTTEPLGYLAPNAVIPWGIDRIDSRIGRDNTYSYSTDGIGVKAYIVDSGVNAAHQEFPSRVLSGWSYRTDLGALSNYNLSVAQNGIPFCTYADGVRNDSDVGKTDIDGHGTHVAGVIGGINTGVAKAVSLVPVRVLDSCGFGTIPMVLNGLNWILEDHKDGEKAVVNMSIGFERTATSIDTAIKSLLAEGIVIVAASGNEGVSACGITPAGTDGTISVGASTSSDGEPFFTNFGSCVDIFAPGQSILSSWPTSSNTYREESGTSMAAPHVTGAVARYLQTATVTATTPTDAWNWLKQNATCNAITYYTPLAPEASRVGAAMTPNRLLAVDAPATVPCAPNGVTATVADRSSVVTWDEVAAGNGAAVTSYTATAMPGGKTCTVESGTTCAIMGLVNNTAYSISVAATNSVGLGTASIAVVTTPVGPPGQVSGLIAKTQKSNALLVSWTQAEGDADGITYTATANPGGRTCVTTKTALTSCAITGLKYGSQYKVSVVGTNTKATALATTLESPVRPGFSVKKTAVKKGSLILMSSLVTSLSTGRKTWRESGQCSIIGTKLRAPKASTNCLLTLKVAKTGKYPAMSTTVRIAVE